MIEYTIERSKRKSVAIYVKNGAVKVKAPLKTSVAAIDRFVQSKSKWITKKLYESNARASRFSDVSALKSFLYMGSTLRITPSERKTLAVSGDELQVPKEYFFCGELIANEAFTHKLVLMYKRLATKYLGNRLKEISEITGLKYSSFSLTNAKTKWGSCDTLNRIRLNWRLILLDKRLSDYVMAHELAHTAEHNHSRKFWETVGRIYPDYKEAIVCLKNAGVLIDVLR